MNNNKDRQAFPELLTELFSLLERHRSSFKQERVFNRVVGLVISELFAFGRHTVTQLLLALGLVDDDWSAWYRLFSHQRFAEGRAAEVMLSAVLENQSESEPFVTGIDGFQVPRCSQKMPGSGWLRALNTAPFKPGIHRAQRFVEGSWLTPIANGYSRAIPLRCLAAFTITAIRSVVSPLREWEAGHRYLLWLRERLDREGRESQPILALADGSFDTTGMWAELPERVILLVRTARNRALYELVQPEGRKGPGRPRSYGPKAPEPAAWLRRLKGFRRRNIVVRGHQRSIRYRVEGPFVRDNLPGIPLFLIVIGGGQRPPGSRRKNYNPCFYLLSAVEREGAWHLPLPIEQILAWLWQRWELEVAHRQMKSALGLGEKQCWNPCSTIVSVQWSAWVYALLVLAGYRSWALNGGPRPPGSWRMPSGRWSFNTLWRGYRAALWEQSEFRASWTPTRDNWLKKEAFMAGMTNSIIAASRA